MNTNNGPNIISDMGILSEISYETYGGASRIFKGAELSADKDEKYFLNSAYTVIDYTSTNTDMQALLLQKNGTTDYVIAFRGTQEKLDIGIDAIIGLDNYNPQFDDAKAFVQDMMASHHISADNLTLTGHSLGGILTQSVGAVLGIKGYAFNSYGTERMLTMWPNYSHSLAETLLDVGIYQILNAFGLDSSYADFARENILNISYNDFGTLNGDILSNFVSALTSDHLGTYLPIFGANVGLDGHKISVLNAAIQHYNGILGHFSDTTTMNDLSLTYVLSGKDGYNRAEMVFSDLNVTTSPDYSLSLDLLATEDSGGKITPYSPSDIESNARIDSAYLSGPG